jgi:hypothetical protein
MPLASARFIVPGHLSEKPPKLKQESRPGNQQRPAIDNRHQVRLIWAF